MSGTSDSNNRILVRAEYKGVNSNNQEYTNDFEPISRENTIVNDLKVVGNRIEPLKSAKMRSTLSRSESFKNSDYSDYTSYRPKTSVLMNRNPLTIDE